MTDILGTVVDALKQIENWPAAVQLCGALIVIGWVLKWLEVFPNRAIPSTLVIFGAIGNVLVVDPHKPGAINPERDLTILMIFQGIIIAGFAILLHKLVLKRFETRLLPFLDGKSESQPVENKNQNQKTQ